MASQLEKARKVKPEEAGPLQERVILIRRVAKVVTGGRRLRFNALVVMGNGQGVVGIGLGKAGSVPDAVQKGRHIAQRNLIRVPLKGTTIPHEITMKFGASQVVLKPAVPGSGVKAGATVRAIAELAGIRDILTKALGNTNPINLARATMEALASLRDPDEELALRRRIAQQSGAR